MIIPFKYHIPTGGDGGEEPARQCRRHETRVQSPDGEDPLEEGMATHSSTCLENIMDGEPSGLQPTGSQRVRHEWGDLALTEAARTETRLNCLLFSLPFLPSLFVLSTWSALWLTDPPADFLRSPHCRISLDLPLLVLQLKVISVSSKSYCTLFLS